MSENYEFLQTDLKAAVLQGTHPNPNPVCQLPNPTSGVPGISVAVAQE